MAEGSYASSVSRERSPIREKMLSQEVRNSPTRLRFNLAEEWREIRSIVTEDNNALNPYQTKVKRFDALVLATMNRIKGQKRLEDQIKHLKAEVTKKDKQNYFADMCNALMFMLADDLDFPSAEALADTLHVERKRMRRALSKPKEWFPTFTENEKEMMGKHNGQEIYPTHCNLLKMLKKCKINPAQFDEWNNIRAERNRGTHVISLFIGDALSYSRVHELEQKYDESKVTMPFDKLAKDLFKVLYKRAQTK